MTTARKIITKAMQKIGALTKSSTPSSDEIVDGLDALNDMLSSWSNDTLTVFSRSRDEFTLSSGVVSYTIGPSQLFDTTRPNAIIAATVKSGGTDFPLTIVDDAQYENSVAQKDAQGLPRLLNYDNNAPTGVIRVYPAPSGAYTINILSEKQLGTLTIDQEVELPPGWNRAIIYNLAIEIAPEYGDRVPPETASIAARSLGAIKRAVAKARPINGTPKVDRGNIYTGWYN